MMHSWGKKDIGKKERESSSLLKYSDVCGENHQTGKNSHHFAAPNIITNYIQLNN